MNVLRTILTARVVRLTALLAATPLAARAQAPAAEAETPAQAAYRAGVEHFKASRFEDAIREFNKAYRLDPNPVLVFNMARAFEETRQYSSAIEFYRRYLAMAPESPDRQAVEDSIRTLELLAAKSQPQAVALSVMSQPDGATVLLDGRAVGVTPMKVDVAPGTHFLALERAGYVRASEEVTLDAGQPLERRVVLVQAPSAEPAADRAGSNLWPWVAVGTGGALLAASAVTGWQAYRKADKLDQLDADPSLGDDALYNDLRDSGQAYALTTDALIVTGSVSLVTGVVLLLTHDDAPKAQ